MRLLLDTHVFLWYISGSDHLPNTFLEEIQRPKNEVYLSIVSIWESVIKYHLGKLLLPEPPGTYLPFQRERHHIESLALYESSIARLGALPNIHRDPFDRILISQALTYDLNLVTVDRKILDYEVPTLTPE
jgi:PIN domain nuclease of toxin-antitoxin system